MPPLEPARRMQSSGPPAKRNRWNCPHCGKQGYGENKTAARVAGERHFLDTHDNTSEKTS